jgi:ABC-type uncharacterized transport system involved in gliding motility auxiliary subunit
MKVTRRTHLLLRLQNIAFVVLFLTTVGLLGWLANRYHVEADWTASGRNTLSEASRSLLQEIPGAVEVTAYARDNQELRTLIQRLVGRYQRAKPDLGLSFVNPDTVPERVRELSISSDGTLVLHYRGRTENLTQLDEQSFTNALQRVARAGQRRVAFLSGHGERDPHGQANHDLGDFSRQLEGKGFAVETLTLAKTPAIADDTRVLVLAGPQLNLLPGEVRLVQDYLRRGGNLLWLGDPGPLHGLEPVAEQLGAHFLAGVVVDASTQLFGIDDPAFAVVAEYPFHPVTRGFTNLTLFPRPAALEVQAPDGWHSEPLLETMERSWTETAPLSGQIRYDEHTDERPGPLTIGVALTRPRPAAGGTPAPNATAASDSAPAEQRALVLGDGDFLANAYLGNGANLDLGIAAFNWLAGDDRFIAIPTKTARDLSLDLSQTESLVIALGFLFVLPFGLLSTGLLIWLRRRKR